MFRKNQQELESCLNVDAEQTPPVTGDGQGDSTGDPNGPGSGSGGGN